MPKHGSKECFSDTDADPLSERPFWTEYDSKPPFAVDWILISVRPKSYGYQEPNYTTLAYYDNHMKEWRTKMGALPLQDTITHYAVIPPIPKVTK